MGESLRLSASSSVEYLKLIDKIIRNDNHYHVIVNTTSDLMTYTASDTREGLNDGIDSGCRLQNDSGVWDGQLVF